VLHGVVTGTAHIANTIYVAVGLWFLSRTRTLALASVAWGVTLASRANFLMLLPLAYGWLVRARGWRAATGAVALAAGTAAALSLPFYLHDPAAFGPLEAADRLTRFDDVLPYSGPGILIVMAAASCALAATGMDRPIVSNAAAVQAADYRRPGAQCGDGRRRTFLRHLRDLLCLVAFLAPPDAEVGQGRPCRERPPEASTRGATPTGAVEPWPGDRQCRSGPAPWRRLPG
jgi:hypothetical protein